MPYRNPPGAEKRQEDRFQGAPPGCQAGEVVSVDAALFQSLATKNGWHEFQVGGLVRGVLNLKGHYFWSDWALIFAKALRQDFVCLAGAGAHLAINLHGQ